MNADALLQKFGRQIGLTELTFDAMRTCGLLFNGQRQVDMHLSFDGEELHLTGGLGQVSLITHMDRGELYRELLLRNRYPETQNESSFAFDSEHDQLLLWRALPIAPLTPEILAQTLEQFVQTMTATEEYLRDFHH